MDICSIRGAITIDKDTREEILSRTKEVLTEILQKNGLKKEDIISVLFTATRDIKSAYPAASARELGLTNASLMCVQEMYVEGSLPMCIRISLTAIGKKQDDIKHIYMREAKKLRPDLTRTEAIAIDGPAGSGKSTVAKLVAKELGFVYVDTGAMYRSCALLSVQEGLDVYDPENVDRIVEISQAAQISFEQREDGQGVFANGQDVTKEIRTPEIDVAVSPVSAIPAVREAMVAQQRKIAEDTDVVAEGRDIGTVVFPKADVKVFLTADPEARALRRAVQRAGGDAAKDATATADQSAVAEIMADLIRRDEADSTRAASPLKPAEDAVHIDSSDKTVDEVVGLIVKMMEEAR